MHIKNIFSDGELEKEAVVANNATTASDGKTYQVAYYNLDVIAANDDSICGSCDIRIQNRERLRHRAEMGIAVRKEYWGTGVAQHILEEAIAEAKRRGIRIICLAVRGDNKRAIAFYKRNGFEFSGVLRMLFCIGSNYVDGEQYELLLK